MPLMPTSRERAEHYLWGGSGAAACDGWRLVQSEQMSVIEERMPPASAEVRHVHRYARQFFYVLTGELVLEVERTEHRLRDGEGMEVAPGEHHVAMNRSGAEVRFLVISAPPSRGDRIDEESM